MTKDLNHKGHASLEIEKRSRKSACTPGLARATAKAIASGMDARDACLYVGISVPLFYQWKKQGEAAVLRVMSQVDEDSPELFKDLIAAVPESQRHFAYFHLLMERAYPIRKRKLLERIEQASLGGQQLTEVRKKFVNKKITLPDGQITNEMRLDSETHITREKLPDWKAAAWILERTHPDEFGPRTRVDKYNWKIELESLYNSEQVSDEDIIKSLGHDLAMEFFISINRQDLVDKHRLLHD